MNDVQTGLTDSLRSLSTQQLEALIVTRREELRLLEDEAASRRLQAKLEAIAMARNLIRAYSIDLREVLGGAPTSSPIDGMSQRVRRVQGGRPPAPVPNESLALTGGPLSRLPSTIRTVLANQGLRTFRDIAQAVDSGAVTRLARMGPTRQRELQTWLSTERARLTNEPEVQSRVDELSTAAVHNPV